MVRGVIAIILVAWVFGTCRAQKALVIDEALEVAEIQVAGNTLVSSKFILDVIGIKVGDLVLPNDPTLGDGIKRLWRQQVVNDISVSLSKVEESKAWLLIEIEELPRLADFEIKGLKKSYKTDLEGNLGLLRGRILTPATLKSAVQTIRNYLGVQGYSQAQIRSYQNSSETLHNSVNLILEVEPGPRSLVTGTQFIGNRNLTDRHLRRVLASNRGFLGKSRLDPKLIDQDHQYLLLEYRRMGFLDASFYQDSLAEVKPNRIQITYSIHEGNRYYVGRITWKGNKLFDSDHLSQVLDISRGDVYNPELLERRLYFDPSTPDISSLYMDQGYIFLAIDPVQIRTRSDTIDLEIRIKEQQQAKVGNVTISGNFVTSEHVIRREIRTLPGDPFSRSQMMRSQRDLAQLGFFDPNQLSVNPTANPKTGLVDLEYSMIEEFNDEFILSGGWGGAYGFVGSAGIVLNNFSSKKLFNLNRWRPYPAGDGQKLGLRFQSNGHSFQNYSLSFTEPWFRGKPNALAFNISHSSQTRDFSFQDDAQQNQIQTGTLKLSGGTLSWTKRLSWPDDYFTLTHGMSYYHYGFDNYQNSLGYNTGSSNNLNFFTTLAWNNIDSPLFPRRGSLFSLNLEFTPPHSLWSNANQESSNQLTWLEYYKWMLDYRKYKTLIGNLVLEGRAHLGFLGAYDNQIGVGPFERFYLGGSGLGGQDVMLGNDVIGLRGYPDNSLVPIDQNGFEGGVLYNKFSLELRYPIIEKPWGTIYVLGFAEAGNNWAHLDDYNPLDYKKSVGLGLRFILPGLGEIGLDWGNGFDPLPGALNASGPQFHITFGKQLR